MINKVGTVCIFVNDQDAAKAFYTEKLGMEVHMDGPLGDGTDNRWISVAPPGAQTEIILYKVDKNWEHYQQVVGKSQAVTLDVTGIDQLVADLKAKGVKVTLDPTTEGWGRHAFILDQDNNSILLVELPKMG